MTEKFDNVIVVAHVCMNYLIYIYKLLPTHFKKNDTSS